MDVVPTSAQLSAMSRLFSSAVFRELAEKGRSALFARLLRQVELGIERAAVETVGDAFEAVFDLLKRVGFRDEYIYKAALTHRVLLGKHNLRTACMLNEFRAGECKADLAILNGTTTVFEIKSERDSLNRLQRQLENYRTVFASAFVIASEKHVGAVLAAVPEDIGVLSLSRRYQITTIREADNRPDRIVPLAVLAAIRTPEAVAMLKAMGCEVPNVPNTLLHRELRKIFEGMDPVVVHAAMLATLKRTRNLLPLSDLVDRLPPSLHAAALSKPLKKSDHLRLIEAVRTPIGEAWAWV
jgi:hypothetical protein